MRVGSDSRSGAPQEIDPSQYFGSQKVDLTVVVWRENKGGAQIEWLLCETKMVDETQDRLRIIIFVFVPYLREVQTEQSLMTEHSHVRLMLYPRSFLTGRVFREGIRRR